MQNDKSAAIEKLLDQEFARSAQDPLHGVGDMGLSLLSRIDAGVAGLGRKVKKAVRAGSTAARTAGEALDRGLVAMGTADQRTHWRWPRSEEA